MSDLTTEQANQILQYRPDVKSAFDADPSKMSLEKRAGTWLQNSEFGGDINSFLSKYSNPAAATTQAEPNVPMDEVGNKTADPYAYLTGAAGATKGLNDLLGITDLQTQMSGLDTTIADKKSKLNTALGTVNENPWLAEASRMGRSKRLQEMANLDIGNVIEQKSLLNEKLGYLTDQMGNVISLGNSQQQTQLQREQMAQSAAEFSTTTELEKAKMNQNQDQFEKNLAFDSLKFQKELGMKKKDADALAKQYNSDLKYKYAALKQSGSQNEEEFDWKKTYDTAYLEHLKRTEDSGSFGDL